MKKRNFGSILLFLLCFFQHTFLGDSTGSWKFPVENVDGEHFLESNFRRQHESPRLRRSPRVDVEKTYDREMPPPKINGTGIPVKFSVLIFSVRGINEIEQEITIEMRLQIWWRDTRVDGWKSSIPSGKRFISITHDVDRKLWHPDIFIDFVKQIVQPELLAVSPVSLRYYETGFLRTSTRVTIRMACPMAFHYYPVDKQSCHVDMKSYAYPNDVLAIQWDEGSNKLSLYKPGMDLPNFELGLDHPTTPMITTSSENFYSSIRFTVLLKRKLSYHFIQTYIPSSLFVIISWLSFLVPPESVPGRMAICMTTLLSQATMFSGIRQSIPKVSYVKALDVSGKIFLKHMLTNSLDTWMVACVFFVFLTLVEYAVILKLRIKIPKEEAKQVRKASGAAQQFPLLQPNPVQAGEQRKASRANSGGSDGLVVPPVYNKYADVVKFLERYSWKLCIALFVVFNLVYWPWLLISAGYYDKFGEDLFYKVTPTQPTHI